jgi:predicted permease
MDGSSGGRDHGVGGSDPEREVDEELAFHVEQRIRDYQSRGMSLEEARVAALERLGELSGVRAECVELLAGEQRRERWGESLRFSWLDFKLGFRMLARYPGLTVVGGLAMAFGVWIGACTFEISRQWIRPDLSLDDADRIVGIQLTNAATREVSGGTLRDFISWREDLKSVEHLSAFRTTQSNLITPESAGEPVEVAEITASAFRVARVPPHLGRFLLESDEAAGAPPVIVLGYDVWQTRFAGDAGIVGRTVGVGGSTATVVGIMPENFAFPVYHDVWTPLPMGLPSGGGAGPRLEVFGRLADGVSMEEAQSELRLLGQRAAQDFPGTHEHLRPGVVAYARSILPMSPDEIVALGWINVAVVMLVALVCGNVALLMFARAATRESEIVVRNALGASRGRIIAQLFAEALVLGTVGTVVGLAAAGHGLRFAVLMFGENLGDLPYWVNANLSPATIVYAGAITLLGAAIAGVLPALRVTRGVGTRLRQAGAGGGGLRFGGLWTVVIVAQVAVTVTFPVVALLIWRALEPIQSFDVGFDENEYLTADLALGEESAAGVPGDQSRAARFARFRSTLEELERRLSAEPAVVGVTFADRLPRMFHREYRIDVVEDAPVPGDSILDLSVKGAAVDLDYLELLGAPILAGRAFHAGDLEAGQRVVIVNQSFVSEVLRGRNAIGRRVRFTNVQYQGALAPEPGPWYEIVGVVRDLGMYHEGGRAGLYHPLAAGSDRVHMLVKMHGDPAAFAPRLRAVASAVDPTLRLRDVRPLNELAAGLLRAIITIVRSALLVSALALFISLAAIYSATSFAVSRRTREIGIRVALGASARRLLFAVFRRPLTQVTIGIVAGGFLAAAVIRIAAGSFSARELGLVTAYAALMMAVCMLACIVPTLRALRIEPTQALKEET